MNYRIVVHSGVPAPAGLVAIFVRRMYGHEPIEVWQEEKPKQDALYRKENGLTERDPIPTKATLPLTPKQKKYRRPIWVTMQMPVTYFAIYDVIYEQAKRGGGVEEISKERQSSPMVLTPEGICMLTSEVCHRMKGYALVGLELNGETYGAQYHLNARKDFENVPMEQMRWINNRGPNGESRSTPPKVPSLYPVSDHEEPPLPDDIELTFRDTSKPYETLDVSEEHMPDVLHVDSLVDPEGWNEARRRQEFGTMGYASQENL